MTWDVEGGGVSVGGHMLPGVHARRGGVVGRTGVVPRAGSLSGVLDRDALGVGIDVTLMDDAATVWTGAVRNVEQRHDQQLNALRFGMRATGPIADLVAVQPGPATRVYKRITVDVALGHLLDAVGWPAARRDIGASARTLGWWWLAGNASPWSEILRLVRTAGPRARLYEDVMGRIVFRDTALPAAAGRTLYGRRALPLLSSALPVVTRLQADDAGRDRVINRARLPYAVAPVPALLNASPTWGAYDVTTEAPSAEAEVAAPAGNVLLVSAFGADASDGTPLPTPSAPSRGVATLAERDHSAVHGSTFSSHTAQVSLMTEDATGALETFDGEGNSRNDRRTGSARNDDSGTVGQVGYYTGDLGHTSISLIQPGPVTMQVPGLPGNAINVQVSIIALTFYSLATSTIVNPFGSPENPGSIRLTRATGIPTVADRGEFVTISRSGSTITVTPAQTPGESGAQIATIYAYDVTVGLSWQVSMAPWTSSALNVGFVKDGSAATYSADMTYDGDAPGIARRAAVNMAALRLINAGEPRVVEAGDQVGEDTVLLAVAVVEGRLDTTASATPSSGWLTIAGRPTLRGGSVTPSGSRRLLWLATRTVAARGPVPAVAWTQTGRTNPYIESVILAIPPEARVIWQEDGTRTLPANRGIVVHAPLAAPPERVLDLIAEVDYRVLSGNVVSAGIGFTGAGPSVQITLRAGPGGATIAGLQLRGSLVNNAGNQVTAEDADSVTEHGSQELPASQVWQWLEETQAQELADAWVEYSAAPRRAWEVVLDGSRGSVTRGAALSLEITQRVRTLLDDDFDVDGEVIGVSHQITEAAGLLTTRVAMLSAAASAAATTPGTPTALTVTPASSQTLRAAWAAPPSGGAQVTSYAVDYRAGSSGAWTTVTGVTERTFTITGLTPSTAYQVRVAGRNRVGLGDYTAPVSATTLMPQPVPGEPTSLTATPAQTSVALSWGAPASGGAVASYSVRHRTGISGEWTTVTGITGMSSTITGLARETAYQFEVQSVNDGGVSAWVRATATTLGLLTAPGIPTSLTATPARTTIAVAWGAPASGGAPASYSVRHRAGATGDWTTVTGITGMTRTITGLTQSTSYHVQVRAVNAAGVSSWALASATTTTPSAPPGPPTGLAAAGLTTTAINVTWTAPSTGGDPASYSLRHRQTGMTAWTTITGISGTGQTITGLTHSTTYEIEVQSVNVGGSSAWVRTTGTTLAPVARPGAPTGLTATPASTSIVVAWTARPAGENVTSYSVRHRAGTTGVWTTSTGISGLTSPIAGLTPETAYQVEVQAVNAGGGGPWSRVTATTLIALPGAPTSVAAAPAQTSIVLTWAAPAAGGAVASYSVRHRAGSSGDYTTVTGITGLTRTISALTPSTAYQVEVQAVNAGGASSWERVTATTLVADPAAPTSVTATPARTSVAVAWVAPAAGGAVASYSVRHRAGATGDWTTATGITGLTRTVTGLRAATAYQFEVQAVNASGVSAWVRATATTTAVALPGAPARIAAATLSSTSLLVAIAPPLDDGGAAITSYGVRYRVQGTMDWTDHPEGGASQTLTGLMPGTAYDIQGRARNSAGAGPWTASTTGRTSATAPDAPAAPTVVGATLALTASWTAPPSNGALITHYDLQHRPTGSTQATQIDGIATRSRTITGLADNTSYDVRVRAANSAGDGPWSAWATASTLLSVPGVPTSVAAAPTQTTIAVTWAAPASGGAVASYSVRHRAGGTGNWTTATGISGLASTIAALTPSTAYQVEVQAVNATGNSAWVRATATTLVAVPGIPTNVAATPARTTIAVTWGAPASGGAVASYSVRHRAGTTGSWTTSTGITVRTATITGLTPATAYQVEVRAVNASGASAWVRETATTLATTGFITFEVEGNALEVEGIALTRGEE